MRKHLGKILIIGGLGALLLVACGLLTAGDYYTQLAAELPSVAGLRTYQPSQTTRIFSKDGQLIATLFRENRTWVPLASLPKALPKALLAVEDRRFYKHSGVDYPGVARAAVANLKGGNVEQGASTLTMQLARNLFLSPERSFKRKLREAMLAQRIESQLSKDEILQLYLNQVYFGAGAHGVHAAAQLYFGKKPKDLTAAEIALLVGLPQAPEQSSPLVNLRAAKQRQLVVLNVMREENLLSQADYVKALAQARRYRPKSQAAGGNNVVLKYPYFTSYVIRQLSEKYDDRTLYEGGLKIYTTLDIKAQKQAEASVRNLMAASGPGYNANSAALVSIDHGSGHIRALVGGRGWSNKNQFNRAWQTFRQAGSTFKIFIYAAALDAGYSPNQVMSDSKVVFQQQGSPDWEPHNSDGRFLGDIPLWQALAQSRNVVSARLVAALGPETVLAYAQRLGVGQKAQPWLSVALGAVETSPLEMASAAGTFANDGVRMDPTPIALVTDSHGRVLEDHRKPQGYQAVTASTARLLTGMLTMVVQQGTGTAARLDDRQVAGKTGTTDGSRDAWFVGYTPEVTTAVWVGNDDHSPMWSCYGGTLPAWIWHDYVASLPVKVASFPATAVAFQKPSQPVRTPPVAAVPAVQAHPAPPAALADYTYQYAEDDTQLEFEPSITRVVDDQGVATYSNTQ